MSDADDQRRHDIALAVFPSMRGGSAVKSAREAYEAADALIAAGKEPPKMADLADKNIAIAELILAAKAVVSVRPTDRFADIKRLDDAIRAVES